MRSNAWMFSLGIGTMVSALLAVLISGVLASGAAEPSAPDPAGPVPPKIEAFLQSCEISRRGAILQLEHQLRGLRSQGAATKETARRAARIEADLSALRANKEPLVPSLKFPPEVGNIGRLPRLTCHVDQILSDDEMLVRCLFSLKVTSVERFQPRYETVVRPVTFLVRGVSTRQTHEAADLELLQVFEVSGTHTYRTVGGSQATVHVLSPFDMKAIEPYFKALAHRQ